MQQSTLEALDNWLSEHPESYHPCDMERFFDFLVQAYRNGELEEVQGINLDNYVSKHKKGWTKEVVFKFVEEWESKISLCSRLLQYMQGRCF